MTLVRFHRPATVNAVSYATGEVADLPREDARFAVVNGHAVLGDGPPTVERFPSTLEGAIDRQKGAANGIAPLGPDSRVAEANLPNHLAATRRPIDPRDYGAAWDGVTDDTLALRSAVAAAIAAKRPLMIPAGTGLIGTVDANGYMIPTMGGLTIYGQAGHDSVLKVKSGTGDYFSIFGPSGAHSTNLTGFTLDNFTIDQNNTGNPATYAGLVTNGKGRFVAAAFLGRRITYSRLVVKDFDSMNVLVANGTALYDATVTDCRFEMGTSTTTDHDHSTLYLAGTGVTVTGNSFTGTLGGNGSRTAIETHGPDQVVVGNRVRAYSKAANITGVFAPGNDNVVVSQNTFADANIGVQLWSQGSGTGLRNCIVSDNVITINRDAWVSKGVLSWGVALDAGADLDFENITIRGNVVHFLPWSAAALAGELGSVGIAARLSSTTTRVSNLDILDNTVINPPSVGVRVQATIDRARVRGNRIVNPGGSTEVGFQSAYRSGIILAGTLTDVSVVNNQTFDTRATPLVAQGVYSNPTATTRCSHSGNTVVRTNGAAVAEFVQVTGVFTSNPPVSLGNRFATALYYAPEGTRNTAAHAAGTVTAVPFWVSSQTTFDRIGAVVTTAGVGGSVVRLGIYDEATGRPGNLILDAGTILGDSATAQEVTTSVTLPPGLYYLAAVNQGGTPTLRTVVGNIVGSGTGSLAGATGPSPHCGYTMTGVTGALPATFTVANYTSGPMLVALRAA